MRGFESGCKRLIMPNFSLIIFSREPVPGHTKTRLIPRYGAAGAAAIHSQLLERTVSTGLTATTKVAAYIDGALSSGYFSQPKNTQLLTLHPQTGADLGERMHNALQETLKAADRALLVGSDCAVHTAAALQTAASALDECDMVFTPAEDGGYVLVGARQSAANRLRAAFAGIDWGTPQVMAQTRQRLAAAHLSCTEMPTLWDIDEPADVERALAAGLIQL